ncbi:MAG TPA: peptidase MA family metallohydrolase [Candidatus Limnocylindrales bacterium]|nr:peptidase MA family metallohydrolase [Candidatus Limnocylindrales bacterium]
MKSIITFCAFAMLCVAARADTIVLKNGDRIQADSAQERNGRVEYTLGDNTMTIPKSIVVRIEKGPVSGPMPSLAAATPEAPPAHEEMASSGDLVSRVLRNGAIDAAAIKAIEEEGDSLRAAAANSIAANFEEKRLNYSAAARYLQAAIAFLPNHGVLLENYASVLLKLGQPAEALLRAQQAARVSPQSADAFLLLGYAYYKNDHDREAIAALKKSLELRPDDKTRDLLERVERESRTEADFRQQESSHFTLRYEGSQAPDALRTQILDALEADYRDLSNDLGSSPRNIYVSLYTDQAFFDVTHAAAWTSALNDGKIRIPISGIKAVTPEMASVLRHELTHSFVAQITHNRAPVWLNEGVAQLEQGSSTGAIGPRLAALYGSGRQIPLNQLEGGFNDYSSAEASVAYAESLAAAEYIRATYGLGDLARLLQRLGEGQSVESALRGTVHGGYAELETEIANYLRKTYGS